MSVYENVYWLLIICTMIDILLNIKIKQMVFQIDNQWARIVLIQVPHSFEEGETMKLLYTCFIALLIPQLNYLLIKLRLSNLLGNWKDKGISCS